MKITPQTDMNYPKQLGHFICQMHLKIDFDLMASNINIFQS